MGSRGPQPLRGTCTTCGKDDDSRRYAGIVCHTCYQRGRYASKPKVRFGPKAMRLHLKGTTYDGAHKHVVRLRGPAKSHPCSATGCTSQAAQWALKPASDRWVQTGLQRHPRGYLMTVSWSGHVGDYTPLCVPCHLALDRGDNAPQILAA